MPQPLEALAVLMVLGLPIGLIVAAVLQRRRTAELVARARARPRPHRLGVAGGRAALLLDRRGGAARAGLGGAEAALARPRRRGVRAHRPLPGRLGCALPRRGQPAGRLGGLPGLPRLRLLRAGPGPRGRWPGRGARPGGPLDRGPLGGAAGPLPPPRHLDARPRRPLAAAARLRGHPLRRPAGGGGAAGAGVAPPARRGRGGGRLHAAGLVPPPTSSTSSSWSARRRSSWPVRWCRTCGCCSGHRAGSPPSARGSWCWPAPSSPWSPPPSRSSSRTSGSPSAGPASRSACWLPASRSGAGLYRVASFVGLAVSLALVLQRFALSERSPGSEA